MIELRWLRKGHDEPVLQWRYYTNTGGWSTWITVLTEWVV